MRETIDAGGKEFQVAIDLATDLVAIAILRVFAEDGETPVALSGPPRLSDSRLQASERPGGLVVITADPLAALPDAASPLAFSLTLTEPGFRTVSVPVALPPNPITPVELPAVTLRGLPVELSGRAVLASNGDPVAGAVLSYAPHPPVAGEVILALGQILPADVPPGTTVRGVSLTPVGGPVPLKTVLEEARAGDTLLTLDDRQGLSAGQILQLGSGDRLSLARMGVVSMTPADLTKPGLVLLATPLTASVRAGDPAQACTTGAPTDTVTSGQSFAGEALLLAGAAPAGDALIVDPGGGAVPLTLTPPTAPDGYYRQAGIARFPSLDITISKVGLSAQTVTWQPAAGATAIDWRMQP
jgi:hypothetical protein